MHHSIQYFIAFLSRIPVPDLIITHMKDLPVLELRTGNTYLYHCLHGAGKSFPELGM